MKSTLSLSLLTLATLTGLSGCSQANDIVTSVSSAKKCEFTAPRSLDLDLSGVDRIHFKAGRHTLHVDAAANGKAQLSGRGCASSQDILDGLHLTQVREGGTLLVGLEHTHDTSLSQGNGKARYGWMEMSVTLPTGLPVDLNVGSGDASARHLPELNANVASGDLRATDIAGSVNLNLASGDVILERIGPLDATVASGDLKASTVNGPVNLIVASGDARLSRTGPVNLSALSSGDVTLSGVQGDLLIGNVGSGDLEADTVAGNVQIAAMGSGDVDLKHITGAVSVRAIGSGDLEVNGAAGLEVMQIGSGDVIHSNVSGRISLPRRN